MSKKLYEPIKVTAFFSHIRVTDVKEWRARNHMVTVGSKCSPVLQLGQLGKESLALLPSAFFRASLPFIPSPLWPLCSQHTP